MARYLVAIHRPNNYDSSTEDNAMSYNIDRLNEDMISAGIRIFVGGLQPIENAKSLKLNSDGEIAISNGPYLKTSEHIGGFWILEVASSDEALQWGQKAAIACRASVEVRPLY